MGIQSAGGYFNLNSDNVTPFQHPVELDRNHLKGLYRQSGALRGGDFAVTPTGTNQQLSISTGSAFVLGQESAQQGGYFGWSDAAELKTFGAPSGSPRIDTLLLRAYDPQYGTLPSGTCRMQWDIVAGTPAATPAARPDSDFVSTGSQWVPGAWMKWAEVRINPGDTVIPSGQIFLPGSVVSGTGTTWSQRYARQSGGVFLCTSASRPASPTLGDRIYETDTKRDYVWNGSAWYWPYPRGFVGGNRYTAGLTTVRATNGTAEAVANITSGFLTLEPNRSFELRWVARIAVSVSAFVILQLRENSISGTIRARGDFVHQTSGTTNDTVIGHYETGAGALGVTYIATTTVSTGAISAYAGDATSLSELAVFDLGPSGIEGVI